MTGSGKTVHFTWDIKIYFFVWDIKIRDIKIYFFMWDIKIYFRLKYSNLPAGCKLNGSSKVLPFSELQRQEAIIRLN